MANPLEQSIREAVRTDRELMDIFGRLGTSDHPRGRVLVSYRNAQRALRDVLGEDTGQALFTRRAAVGEILRDLRGSVRGHAREAVGQGAQSGIDSANRQLAYYGEHSSRLPKDRPTPAQPSEMDTQQTEAVEAVLGVVDQQIQTVQTLVTGGADRALILGDDNRQGVLRPAPVISTAAFWVATLAFTGFIATVRARPRQLDYQKQAVAALDERTTDCCLRVHGQIQPLDETFTLVGTPRYADELQGPPFHWWCRTSTVLYLPVFDEGLTDRMRQSARTILDERARGVDKERHPADAFA